MLEGLLIVDDEEGVRRSLRRALEREPYLLYLAENGQQAVEMAKEHLLEIGIVVADLKMPGMDGLETLSEIHRLNPEVTRIMLTGYATMEVAIQAINEGIDGFMTKPFNNLELRAKIRECFIKRRLKQFVSAQILGEIEKDPTQLRPRKQEVSILMTDIRGFSSLADRLEPQELAQFLDTYYFNPLGDIIFRKNGTLDKHIGDSIMAIFGAPVSFPNDALRAVEAAWEIRQKVEQIGEELQRSHGWGLAVGMAISTGEVVTGIFGSRRKKEYTAYGSPVILAARLERMAKKGQILISERTYQESLHRIFAEALPSVELKGIAGCNPVYNVLGLR